MQANCQGQKKIIRFGEVSDWAVIITAVLLRRCYEIFKFLKFRYTQPLFAKVLLIKMYRFYTYKNKIFRNRKKYSILAGRFVCYSFWQKHENVPL